MLQQVTMPHAASHQGSRRSNLSMLGRLRFLQERSIQGGLRERSCHLACHARSQSDRRSHASQSVLARCEHTVVPLLLTFLNKQSCGMQRDEHHMTPRGSTVFNWTGGSGRRGVITKFMRRVHTSQAQPGPYSCDTRELGGPGPGASVVFCLVLAGCCMHQISQRQR